MAFSNQRFGAAIPAADPSGYRGATVG